MTKQPQRKQQTDTGERGPVPQGLGDDTGEPTWRDPGAIASDREEQEQQQQESGEDTEQESTEQQQQRQGRQAQ
jgi:hypothetical protein